MEPIATSIVEMDILKIQKTMSAQNALVIVQFARAKLIIAFLVKAATSFGLKITLAETIALATNTKKQQETLAKNALTSAKNATDLLLIIVLNVKTITCLKLTLVLEIVLVELGIMLMAQLKTVKVVQLDVILA